MKNKTLLLLTLALSSSILHAELNPLAGAGSDMVKDSATGAAKDMAKEAVTNSAKDMMKEAAAPVAPKDNPQGVETANPAGEKMQATDKSVTSTDTLKNQPTSTPASTEEPVKAVKHKAHKKSSKKHH
jgi:hypothetical protein